jgi:hypothetical protein
VFVVQYVSSQGVKYVKCGGRRKKKKKERGEEGGRRKMKGMEEG